MPNITYYATKLSPRIAETEEGFIIARDVPICRSGYQEYLGSELKKHPNYRDEWGLQDHVTYKVFGPEAEVTSAATVASFEGKPIADEHPPEHLAPGSLITLDNAGELGRGHIQNVRVGPNRIGGEAVLLGDMFLKDPDLVSKVIDDNVRDVSCGYTYQLNRSNSGDLRMSNIRGNHVAVVREGRAGKSCAIGDSSGAIVPDSNFGGNSAYEWSARGHRPAGPPPAEIKAAYEELRALVASVAHRYGPIPPNVVFTTEEQGASVLQALSDLVANSSSVAYSISATPATKRSGADRAILDSWMHAQRVLSAVRNGADNAYAALAGMRGPSGMDAQPERGPAEFFNGVPYAVGRQRYEDYLAARRASRSE